ncbi:hypothetical protein EUGRSUZ_F03539 [Eucalyptus grandis]|uniref:Uncharacterized protein n=2 Tax=Eucalyptus grandis TaxID=71139 RepID=A0ACC3KLG2_EUCGR|nr:hypothetical protein EUGRSUZ_F03539 [Eucalyptus grandis]
MHVANPTQCHQSPHFKQAKDIKVSHSCLSGQTPSSKVTHLYVSSLIHLTDVVLEKYLKSREDKSIKFD